MTVVSEQAQPPLCLDDTWIFDLPAEERPSTPRRSEVLLSDGDTPALAHEGSTVTLEAEIVADLGESGMEDQAWHVLWQLQGPTKGEWLPPPIGMQVRRGQLILGGGAGHPKHDWSTNDYEWRVPLGPFRNGTPIRVKVVVTVSSHVEKGTVSAWFDGRQVLDAWIPTSDDGNRPGTLYPGQSAVGDRIGLYRGSQGEAPPTYRQVVRTRIRDFEIR